VTSQAMTNGLSGRRRRTAVSVLLPVASSEPVEQLDHAIEAIHRINRALPKTVLGREELLAIGGLLTQVSSALLTLTDLLSAPAHHYDRTRLRRTDAGTTSTQPPAAATKLLQNCRNGYLAASNSARAFHADLKRCPRAEVATAMAAATTKTSRRPSSQRH
jgi:hypothetical protein